ncbi:aminotransferase class I/II-fold pyridoxal phosphate-dependent enzyme [Roseomonas sp. OT10]|uniref:aminotransferase class I/II-fold pyridoxal phosphate-dependent enzyme n=1 Tax=Roseomonas cutis TaxID=2897332 RepID=UPI001E2BF8F6|nr:aminotransferase class I/II-fold pyridoxal phosphate-dependent enzyme [Roseomonas sp. OT10]UFN46966.1 aminotransferase class I/II-fold pyridoxal phosphate-dependent enzyme [Roseomonas sp. OT10]
MTASSPSIADLSDAEFAALAARTRADYDAFRGRGLKLDMTRGKPAPEQLSLSEAMLTLPGNGDVTAEDGTDARNYGGLNGLPEMRAFYGAILGAPAAQVVIGDNSSLALMHDVVALASRKGVPGGAAPWGKEEVVTFLCPVPGYDRHFVICEEYGIRMVPVPLTGQGPDMDQVEALVAEDATVKGMWCVPRYGNPSGEIWSEETVRRLAAMKTAAPDFRLFWDDAYAVHHLTEARHGLANVLELAAAAGNPDRPVVFASTSKVTLAGAGIAALAASPANVAWYLAAASVRTIGPDKLNQLRHLRFLRDLEGVHAHMARHRALIVPKFAAVQAALESRLGGLGVARWTKPEGGYFISVDAWPGTAGRVVALAKEAGLALTPAGSTWPYGKDPQDSNLRLAPTFPSLSDVTAASEGIALCLLLAAIEAQEAVRGAKAG